MYVGSILLAVFAMLANILLVPAFIWHAKYSKSIPVLFLLSWLAYSNLVTFINSIVWSGDDFDTTWDGKGYCDITSRLDVGSFSGRVCALSAITLNLLMILKGNPTFVARDGPLYRRKVFINLLICCVTPVFVMVLQFFVAAQRYDIVKYEGCISPMVNTPLALVFYSMWPFSWSLVGLVFAVLTLYEYYKKRKDVRDLLRCSNSGLDMKKFARILIFSIIMVIVITPVAIFNFASDVTASTHESSPFSWNKIHYKYWGEILFLDGEYYLVYPQWINVGLSVVGFVVFGSGTEAMAIYKSVFNKMLGRKHKNTPVVDEVDLVYMADLSKDPTATTLGRGGSNLFKNTTLSLNALLEKTAVLQELNNDMKGYLPDDFILQEKIDSESESLSGKYRGESFIFQEELNGDSENPVSPSGDMVYHYLITRQD